MGIWTFACRGVDGTPEFWQVAENKTGAEGDFGELFGESRQSGRESSKLDNRKLRLLINLQIF
jgi:hypothetical protein